MSMRIIAEKLHGAQNDFFFIEVSKNPRVRLSDLRLLVRKLCHRRHGLGADGVVLWDADARRVSMLIINSDGTFAGTCGNALRCLGLLCLERGLWQGESALPVHRLVPTAETLSLQSDEGFVLRPEVFAVLTSGVLVSDGKGLVHVVMGQESSLAVEAPGTAELLPLLEPAFPGLFRPSYEDSARSSPQTAGKRMSLEHVRVSLSNPHWVFVSESFAGFREADFVRFGEMAQGALRNRGGESVPLSNIGMVTPLHEGVEDAATHPTFPLVVFERGAGLTPCCGSGATAARVALEALGFVNIDSDQVSFRMPGGTVGVRWTEDAPLLRVLVGPAERVAVLDVVV